MSSDYLKEHLAYFIWPCHGLVLLLLLASLQLAFLDFFESFLDFVVVVENQRV